MARRAHMWEGLPEKVDLLVIGGGINGAGIARDAAQRGLRVAVVERGDVASGTSSRSSKLVHGGVRYLEMFEFSLVFESVSERRILLDIAPHIVRPLSFLFPVFTHSRRSLTTISAGLRVYEVLALFRSPKRPKKLKAAALREEEPILNQEELVGAPLYYDCATDDTRLTLENAIAAIADDAHFVTYAEATGFEHDADGQICAVHVKDRLEGHTRTIYANAVVNAGGPWVDRIAHMREEDQDRTLLRPTKGVHFSVAREVLPLRHAIVCFHPDDQRVLFALPWGDSTYVGTTDTDYDGDPAEVYATREDIDYLIRATDAYFPDHPVTHADIHSTWAGLRPLVQPRNKKSTEASAVSREHFLDVSGDGLITIAGGKLTTYRRMCEEVVDTVIRLLKMRNMLPDHIMRKGITDESLLPGAIAWPIDDEASVIDRIVETSDGHLDAESANLLAYTYGMRALDVAALVKETPALGERILPHRPEIMAQIDFGVEEEFACTVHDILKQRTQIYYRDAHQGLHAVQKVADRMAELLGWTEETTARFVREYQEDVARNQDWKQPPASGPTSA